MVDATPPKSKTIAPSPNCHYSTATIVTRPIVALQHDSQVGIPRSCLAGQLQHFISVPAKSKMDGFIRITFSKKCRIVITEDWLSR
jgi:hypothetical protein